MDIFQLAERSMKMSPETWARHANPRSVYTRLVSGTLIFLCLWSVFWLGWYSILLIAVAIVWTVLNPRLFEPPQDTRSWATRGVLGERVFLNRRSVPIPAEHTRFAWITAGLSIVFMLFAVLGFVLRDFWLAFCAWHAATVAKVWFVDRMAWLWEEMKEAHPMYHAWSDCRWDVEADVG